MYGWYLKIVLTNFLNPEDEEESTQMEPVKDETGVKADLKKEKKSNYSLSTKKEIAKPEDKFDALFDDDDDMPF